MSTDPRPVRFPQRRLTPEQAARFAALREEIETALTSGKGRTSPG
jgi:hypothetical protein